MRKSMLSDTRIRVLFILICGGGLTACGFITAPLSLATAEVASSGVKAADYSLEQGQQAAIYVRARSADAANASWRFLQETGANIRHDLFPSDLPQHSVPLNSDGSNVLAAELD